jgi:TIR domain
MADRRKVRVFISYSHHDTEDCITLQNHLAPLNNKIDLWWDSRLRAGEWSRDIFEYLDGADLILLLVTAEFVASKNCEDEYRRALERFEAFNKRKPGGARVVPVWLRTIAYGKTAFAKLNPFPPGNRAIDQWGNRDKAFTRVCEALDNVVDEILEGFTPELAWETTACGRLASLRSKAAPDEQAWLLPHLCDRTELEIAIREACRPAAASATVKARQPIVYLICGHEDDCPEGFRMRLEHRVLPQLMGVPGRVQAIPLDWPFEPARERTASADFALRLSAKLGCDPSQLGSAIDQRPVTFLRTEVDRDLWLRTGKPVLRGFLNFCRGLGVASQGRVIADVMFHLRGGSSVEHERFSRRLRSWFKGSERAALRGLHIDETTREFVDFPGLRGAIGEFIPITLAHAKNWLADVEVRAWCLPNSETDMATDFQRCFSGQPVQMGRLLGPMEGLLLKYRKAN